MRTLLVAALCWLSIAATAQLRSVQSGNWSDIQTWGGRTPGSNEKVIIPTGISVNYDVELSTVAGVEIEGTLTFDQNKSVTLQSNRNIVVKGLLEMHPSSQHVVSTIRFIEIKESNFVGGGHDVLDSDVGLWVMGSGRVDLVGTPKKPWTNAQASISKGSSSILLKEGVDWMPQDDIAIAPTEPSTSTTYQTSFDDLQITEVNGSQLAVKAATNFNHPAVANKWTAEVMNLTRNVRIEGTPNGRTHMLVRSMSKQNVRWVQFRYVGPRKNRNDDLVPDMIPGRYGLHFHHSMDGSRGTVIEGNVIRDCGNHAYVPHTSHGITFKSNISYNTLEDPYWWDPGHISHDITFDGNIAARVAYVYRSTGLNASGSPTYGSTGFLLGMGDGNVAINNIVIGQQSRRADICAGYLWQADNEGLWEFKNNMVHNSTTGIRIWQNTHLPHFIENFDAYYAKLGVFHGAYANSYRYSGGTLYAAPFDLRATSASMYSLRVENFVMDGGGIIASPIIFGNSKLAGSRPALFRNVKVSNYLRSAVSYELKSDSKKKVADFVSCDLGNRDFYFVSPMLYGDIIRVQPLLGRPFQITRSGRSYINEFSTKVWGDGKGLTGKYYKKKDLTEIAYMRNDAAVFNSNLEQRLPYTIIDRSNYSISWEGMVMSQVTAPVTFHLESGGGHRLWVNNKLVLDSWFEKYPKEYNAAAMAMEAGKQYQIRLEYFNATNTAAKAVLRWSAAGLPKEVVPQSQLYPAIAVIENDNDPGGMGEDHDGHHQANVSVNAVETPSAIVPEMAAKISVFPVPSAGQVTLTSKGNILENAKLEVVNSSGSKVYEYHNRSAKTVSLNLRHLSNGVYFIWVRGTASPVVERIVIQK